MRTRTRLWRFLRAELSGLLGRKAERPFAHGRAQSAGEPPPPKQDEAELRLKRAYRALELPHGASLEDVRAAYKTLMKRYHPDRFQDADKRKDATELVKRLNEAYAVLLEHLEAQSAR